MLAKFSLNEGSLLKNDIPIKGHIGFVGKSSELSAASAVAQQQHTMSNISPLSTLSKFRIAFVN